jgi:hypothetical protein
MTNTILPYYSEDQIVEMIGHVIDQTYTVDILEDVKQKTLREARPYGPGHMSTRDYRPGRINLVVDGQQVIEAIHFG